MDKLKPKRTRRLRGVAAWAPFHSVPVCHESDQEGGKDRVGFFPKVLSTREEGSVRELLGKALGSSGE